MIRYSRSDLSSVSVMVDGKFLCEAGLHETFSLADVYKRQVCEEMCTGTRYFENLVDESQTTLEGQFMALAQRYMKTNCACFTPNTGRIDDILRMAKEYQVDGVIDVNLKFCCLYDTEGYTVEKALKEAGIPVLGIETDYTDTDAEQLRTRVEAFVEMLG